MNTKDFFGEWLLDEEEGKDGQVSASEFLKQT
jgi:hypothetical protein